MVNNKNIPFSLTLEDGETIRADLYPPSGENKGLLLVFVHGFKGFKEWGFFPYFGEYFSSLGYPVVTFNFSLNGVGEDLLNFTELEKFKENTFTREKDELGVFLDKIQAGLLPTEIDFSSIVLVGHSRGGYSSLCCAASRTDISGLISLASICDTGTISTERESKWREDRVRFITNTRTKQEMPLGVGLLEDILMLPGEIEKQAWKLQIPHLILHGSEDSVVAPSSAEQLSSWSPHSKLHIISGADHVFGARHPWQGETVQLRQVVELTAHFLSELRGSSR